MDYVEDGEVPDDAIYVDLTETEPGGWMHDTRENRKRFSELTEAEAALKARKYGMKLFDLYLQRVEEANYDTEKADSVQDQGNIVEDTLERGVNDARFVKQTLKEN